MANISYILNQIKINGALQDLITKSNGDNVKVTYDGTEQTLTSALSTILANIKALPTSAGVSQNIQDAIDNLIGGAPATYDTLKEISDYIAAHPDVSDALNAAIATKADKTEFETVKAAVEALGNLSTKDKVAEDDLDTSLAQKVNAVVEGKHNHANKSVLDGITAEKVTAWDSKADKTIATSSAAGLMSSADKSRLDGIRGVRYGTEPPSDMLDGELFVKVVETTV